MCYSALVKRDLDHLRTRYGAIQVRTDYEVYQRDSKANPKRFPPFEDRIFPGHYAPVIYDRDGGRVTSPMRYGAYPPASVANPKIYTTFNARRDNLTSTFWSGAFMRHHGLVVLEAFYEWVAVKDLLAAGVVTLDEVKAEFAKQAEERKAKILASGKKYRPTPTEQKDPRTRQIIIEFAPEDGSELVAPAIFSYAKIGDGESERWDAGFAIVTDDPPLEVSDAGHDRCPVILDREAVERWLRPDGLTPEAVIELLGRKQRITFKHKLAEAA
jgi:putative SOS response-associated peptidase YedK